MHSLAASGHDGLNLVLIDADHGFAEVFGQLGEQIGVLPVGGSLDDGGM